MIKALLTFLAVVVMQGCTAFNPGKNELINELIIHNETNSTLLDVTLRVPETNMIVSTNAILPFREYSLGFQALENKRRAATLSWVHNNVNYKRDIHSVISKSIDKSRAAKVVIRIGIDGSMQSSIEPR